MLFVLSNSLIAKLISKHVNICLHFDVLKNPGYIMSCYFMFGYITLYCIVLYVVQCCVTTLRYVTFVIRYIILYYIYAREIANNACKIWLSSNVLERQ
jgi:hypothetical protein